MRFHVPFWPSTGTLAFSTAALVANLVLANALPAQKPVSDSRERRSVYFQVDAGELVGGFDESNVVAELAQRPAGNSPAQWPTRIVVSQGAEAYLIPTSQANEAMIGYKIVGVKPAGEPISGSLYRVQPQEGEPQGAVLARFAFRVEDADMNPTTKTEFHKAKGRHFEDLWSEEYAGAAMFRHLAVESLAQTGEKARKRSTSRGRTFNRDVDRTIALMSGGRAVSENLQLDRQLRTTAATDDKWVDIAGITGITVKEMEWKELLAGREPELDPLAKLIPHDQYAVFIPNFATLAGLVDQGQTLATPLVQAIEPQSRAVDALGFYQTQLGLPMNALTKQVGKALIGEIAVTGSDPYFRTGTDIAVIMQTDQTQLLQKSIEAQITASATHHRDVQKSERTIAQTPCIQWVNPTRTCSSIVAVVGDSVVVANSARLIEQIALCEQQKQRRLSDLDEYRFFRDRYPRGNDESAFIMVTDAAIRKWCGPKWRIAASRRTRARATIAEFTMRYADQLVTQSITEPVKVDYTDDLPDAGKLTVLTNAVVSSEYGTMSFQTPIAEMDLTRVTTQEGRMYTNWRDRYQRRWRNVFDPIGIQIKMQQEAISVDVSVIPLIMGTEYRWWAGFVGDTTLPPVVGDYHPEAMASMQIALDTDGWLFQMARQFLANNTNVRFDLLGWIDDAVEIYVDYDEDYMAAMAELDPDRLGGTRELVELPMGIYFPSKNTASLTAFMVALRGFLDRVAPNVIESESKEHNGLKYITLTPQDRRNETQPSLYYVTTGDGLTFSFNENVIRRAIDRHQARQDQDQVIAPERSFPPQAGMRITGVGARAMLNNRRDHLRFTRENAWSNIPILNYFRARYPDRDPKNVYAYLFGEQIVEPMSGNYVWNELHQTYQSSLHGDRLQPLAGPLLGPQFGPRDEIRFQMSLQGDGLRAKADFRRDAVEGIAPALAESIE